MQFSQSKFYPCSELIDTIRFAVKELSVDDVDDFFELSILFLSQTPSSIKQVIFLIFNCEIPWSCCKYRFLFLIPHKLWLVSARFYVSIPLHLLILLDFIRFFTIILNPGFSTRFVWLSICRRNASWYCKVACITHWSSRCYPNGFGWKFQCNRKEFAYSLIWNYFF